MRLRRNLSLDELSFKTGLSKSGLAKIENGESSPTGVNLCKISDSLEVDICSICVCKLLSRSILKGENNMVNKKKESELTRIIVVDISGALGSSVIHDEAIIPTEKAVEFMCKYSDVQKYRFVII